MWMWTDEETLAKLAQSVQKWSELLVGQNVDLNHDVVDTGFEHAKSNASKILSRFGLSAETERVLTAWVELGLFGGFLAGYKASVELLHENKRRLEGQIDVLPSDQAARDFAQSSIKVIFTKLLQSPRSPLIEGLPDQAVDLLRFLYESSLYAGYRDAIETSYREITGQHLGPDFFIET